MEITNVKVRLVEGHPTIRATASVVFDNCFVVHDLKIIEGRKGIFVGMPGRVMKGLDDEVNRVDVVHPINQEFRGYLSDKVMKEYWKKKILV